MEEKMPQKEINLDRFSVWIVLAIGLFVIIVGIYQFRTTLYSSKESTANRLEQALAQNQSTGEVNEQIQVDPTRDDDSDGISNNDEINVYGTSPYLIDTDSDGISDAEEIAANTDPNCPEGGDCQAERVAGDGTSTEAQAAFNELTPTISEEELTREEIEAILVERGFTAEQLLNLSDQEIQDAYLSLQQQIESGADGTTNIQQTVDALLALPVEEKRALLIESGVDTETVNALSDEELNALIQEAVDTVLQQGEAPENSDQNTNQDETSQNQ